MLDILAIIALVLTITIIVYLVRSKPYVKKSNNDIKNINTPIIQETVLSEEIVKKPKIKKATKKPKIKKTIKK